MNYMEEYKAKHQHPWNKATHLVGIPTILVSLVVVFFSWPWGLFLFTVGWMIQITGHIIEGNQPAFFHQPIHLISGPIWWVRNLFAFRGRD